MKELIDKQEALKALCGGCGYCFRKDFECLKCNVYKIISGVPPVVCVSDDFTLKPKEVNTNE